MKRMAVKIAKNWLASIFAMALLIGFVACENDDDEDDAPTIAEIRTLDTDGEAVADATVLLTCESSVNRPCDIEIEGKTNQNGVYTREFELPKVLKVNAYKVLSDTQVTGVFPDTNITVTYDSICGEAYISIIANEKSRQSIVLYECN
ncbi:hypothetical protein [Salibacter sp.]|uniref:hypothetical protein n=1 Tax=Salibacter sp. TaxID=2010995 RepID=UPI00286FFFFD|nr:hypothetical protein [Salibacter sp.]MDR9398125.1 hypothetical protein [Salibacter sp.]MDR9487561.1 hypothetical protein [Salibacter sp.]